MKTPRDLTYELSGRVYRNEITEEEAVSQLLLRMDTTPEGALELIRRPSKWERHGSDFQEE